MDNEFILEDFLDLDINKDDELCTKRSTCDVCERPVSVCLCQYLPNPRIKSRIRIWLLQHPNEEKRQIRTGRLLQLGLQENSCQVVKSRKFPGSNSQLKEILESETTALLYPGEKARELCETSSPDTEIKDLLILDGTWDQAKKMFQRNPCLQKIKQIKLNLSKASEYVVRTQPSVLGLSTIEIAAHSLAILEGRPDLVDPLLEPLHALCRIQLDYGEVKHQSKDVKPTK